MEQLTTTLISGLMTCLLISTAPRLRHDEAIVVDFLNMMTLKVLVLNDLLR